MAILYKYRAINDWTRSIICDDEIYFSSPSDFNDPFDCQLNILDTIDLSGDLRKIHEELHQADGKRKCSTSVAILRNGFDAAYDQLEPQEVIKSMIINAVWDEIGEYEAVKSSINKIRKYISRMGVLCLTEDPGNILMFSHYAASHSGLVLGFDSALLRDTFGHLENVRYTEAMPDVSLSNPLDVFYVKAKEWEYEREVRLLSGRSGLKKIHPRALRHVILGLAASASACESVQSWILQSGKKVKLLQARKVRKDFRLRIVSFAGPEQ